MHLNLFFRENLNPWVREELDQLVATLNAAWDTQHNGDGTHGDVTLALGTPQPTSFTSGIGIWMAPNQQGTYQFRVGDPDGGYIAWDGTTLNISGSVIITGYALADLTNVTGNYAGSGSVGGNALDTDAVAGTAATTVEDGAGRAITGLSALGVPTLPSTATPSGSGLFLGSDKLGYYAAGAWKTYMDNSGNFYLGGTSGALQWNGSSLSISGSITVTGGNAAKTDLSNVTGNYAGSASVAGSANDTALVNGVAAATVQGGAARANTGLNASGVLVTKAVPASVAGPSGAGLYLGSDYMGYYNGSAWKTYFDNSGNMTLAGAGDNTLVWNGTTLSINASSVYAGSNGTSYGAVRLWSATEAVGGGSPAPSSGMYTTGTTELHIFNNYTGGTVYIDNNVRVSGGFTMGSGVYLYPGTASGLSAYQTSYYLASHATYGLYSNTGLALNASLYVIGANVYTDSIYSFVGDQNTYLSNYAADSLAFVVGGTQVLNIPSTGHLQPAVDNTWSLGVSGKRFSEVWAANGTIQTSDATLKDDIQDTDLGLDFIMAMRPKSWVWKDGTDRRRYYGVTSQDVAAALGNKAEAFGGLRSGDGAPDGLNYSAFIAPLVAAVQEQHARITRLEALLK